MEKRTYKLLQMADNLYTGNEKLKLINSFNWKPLNSNFLHVLSSIMMLSILGIADSSFAFEAKVKEETLATYWYPAEHSIISDDNIGRGNTVIILYCRYIDHWCYLESFKKSRERIINLQRWVTRDQLCSDDTVGSPLLSCNPNQPYNRIDAILKVRKYYCSTNNPFYWFDTQFTKLLDNNCSNTGR
jgi:hypothetical protein